MLEIGINSNNECGSNIDEILQNVKNAGFKNVMIAAKSGNIEQSIISAEKLGLKIPFVHLPNSNDLWCEGQCAKEYIAEIISILDVCKKHNIKIAVLHATRGCPNELALLPSEIGLKNITKIVNYAKKCSIKIALENLDAPNFKHFCYVLDNINSNYLGFCYDIGHHILYNPKVDILKKYGKRILAIHVHDNLMDWHYGQDWSRDLHMLPFDGKLNYNKILNKLAKTSYNNVFMLELHKDCFGETGLYDNMTVRNYLHEAKIRAEKLSYMLEQSKK